MSFFMGTTILAKRFWDQYFPLFTRFCTEFAATGNTHSWIGPNKISPPSLWTKLRSITCARYVKGVWLVTPNTVRGEGLTWITFSLHERPSVPNVLTRIVLNSLADLYWFALSWHSFSVSCVITWLAHYNTYFNISQEIIYLVQTNSDISLLWLLEIPWLACHLRDNYFVKNDLSVLVLTVKLRSSGQLKTRRAI